MKLAWQHAVDENKLRILLYICFPPPANFNLYIYNKMHNLQNTVTFQDVWHEYDVLYASLHKYNLASGKGLFSFFVDKNVVFVRKHHH